MKTRKLPIDEESHEKALRKAKKLWGPRATVDYNPIYELCCAVGVMSVPDPGDHSRFILKGIGRDWDSCFKAAELNDNHVLTARGAALL